MKKILITMITSLTLALAAGISAQSQNGVSIDTEIVSSYLWRGQLYSPTLNIQPSVTFTGLNEKLSIGAWGSYAVGEYFNEIDLFASVSLGNFAFTVMDYYTISTETDYRYFDFKPRTTGHAIEAIAEWQVSESFPLLLTWGTFIYGADLDDDEGNNMYSSYLEAGYSFDVKETAVSLFAGATPWKSSYAKKFAFVNVGLSAEKYLKITDNFHIPVKGTLAINPYDQRAFLVVSVLF